MSPISRRSLIQSAAALAATPVAAEQWSITSAMAQEPSAPISVFASGLFTPRGLTFGPDGKLYVALGGNGTAGAAPSAVRIEDGCGVVVAHGQPSTQGMSGAVQGPGSVAFLGDQLYLLQDSEDDRGDLISTYPNGVYTVASDGVCTLLADVSTWMNENPTKEIPADRGKLGETFAMLAGDGFLWVIESNEGQVLKVTPDGTITRVVDLSEGHPVPTCCAAAPDGGLYVGNLTDAPYPTGKAQVIHVKADGSVETVWTGLTMLVGLATVDGTLYACEMATNNTTQPPFTQPGTGRIVKQSGPDKLTEVVSELDFPIGMTVGPDGFLYVSTPSFGGDGPSGSVLRIDPSATFLSAPPDLYADATCPGFQEAWKAQQSVFATMTANANKPVPTAQAAIPANTAPVTIVNFTFNPGSLTINAGRTVTWTNKDSVPHTATSKDGAFDSGNLNQGQSFSFTFDKPGTYDYICTYHPYMVGTIVVE